LAQQGHDVMMPGGGLGSQKTAQASASARIVKSQLGITGAWIAGVSMTPPLMRKTMTVSSIARPMSACKCRPRRKMSGRALTVAGIAAARANRFSKGVSVMKGCQKKAANIFYDATLNLIVH